MILEEAVGRFSAFCRFKNVVDQFEWAFTRVYGPNSDGDRRLLWDELFGLCSWWNISWCVWEETLMLCCFPMNIWALSFLPRLCISSQILFPNMV